MWHKSVEYKRYNRTDTTWHNGRSDSAGLSRTNGAQNLHTTVQKSRICFRPHVRCLTYDGMGTTTMIKYPVPTMMMMMMMMMTMLQLLLLITINLGCSLTRQTYCSAVTPAAYPTVGQRDNFRRLTKWDNETVE